MRNPSNLEKDIAALPELSLGGLRERWTVLTGTPAPKSFRTKFLARAVAYQMQAKALGGLPRAPFQCSISQHECLAGVPGLRFTTTDGGFLPALRRRLNGSSSP